MPPAASLAEDLDEHTLGAVAAPAARLAFTRPLILRLMLASSIPYGRRWAHGNDAANPPIGPAAAAARLGVFATQKVAGFVLLDEGDWRAVRAAAAL